MEALRRAYPQSHIGRTAAGEIALEYWAKDCEGRCQFQLQRDCCR
ncbi:MAG: hypothetical protein ACLR23_08840 [Clostridia bacterium]